MAEFLRIANIVLVGNIFILQRQVVCESSAGVAESEVSVYVLFKLLQLSKSRLHLSRLTFIPAQHVTCQRQSPFKRPFSHTAPERKTGVFQLHPLGLSRRAL